MKSPAQEARERKYTYVFKYFDKELNSYIPIYDKKTGRQTKRSLSNEKLKGVTITLYRAPEKPPYDMYIRHGNYQLALLTEYFRDVFHDESAQRGVGPSHTFSKILLPESTYYEIMEVINDNGLLPIRDLILEIISIAQKNYSEDISFWEQESNKKLITTAKKETEKAIEILSKTEPLNFLDQQKKTVKLQGINFLFSDGPIKIQHEWLAGEFIDHFRDYYNNLPFKDWKKDLKRYPERFKEDEDKLNYRFLLAVSFYQMLTEQGFFKIDKKKTTPNNLMICIGKLIEFCLVKVGAEGDSDNNKAKIVRNWIQRSTYKRNPAYVNLQADLPRLEKYFPKNFLGLGELTKRSDALSASIYMAIRFDLKPLAADLTHLYQCLAQVNHYIGFQITAEGKKDPDDFLEFKAFKSLLLGTKESKKIEKLTFKIEGIEQELTLNSSLPLGIIADAVKAYQLRNRIEIDTELYKVEYEKQKDGLIQISYENSFIDPEDRFVVNFVGGFYNYLKQETDLGKNKIDSPYHYYEIIAVFLSRSPFFYTGQESEDYAFDMVKKWHALYLSKKEFYL